MQACQQLCSALLVAYVQLPATYQLACCATMVAPAVSAGSIRTGLIAGSLWLPAYQPTVLLHAVTTTARLAAQAGMISVEMAVAC